jgi:hypothetical protein
MTWLAQMDDLEEGVREEREKDNEQDGGWT